MVFCEGKREEVAERLKAARAAGVELEQNLAKCAESSSSLQRLFGSSLPAHEVCLLFDGVFLPEDRLQGSTVAERFGDGAAFSAADFSALWADVPTDKVSVGKGLSLAPST